MAELAYGIAGSILEKLGSAGYGEMRSAWGMKKDLKKLEEKTEILRSVLKDAEKKQARNGPLRMWLVRLKDVFSDAVDVLDEFGCEILRNQVLKEYGGFGTKVCRFFSSSNPIAFRFSIAHKVKKVRERLDEIAQDMAQFQLISSQLNGLEERYLLIDQERMNRMTHSFVNASEVIGRESDEAEILNMLLSQDDDNLSVIAIVGIGGLGKTTLAKSVYNDKKVDERFDLKFWVCVSLDFDVTRLLKEILWVTKEEGDVNNMSINELQTSLRSVLEGERFLLVLDDVWNEDRIKWLELRQFLTRGEKGSKVIVTTRSTSVSSIMTGTPPYHLQGLSEKDSLSLFFTCAFEDEKLVEKYPRVKDIGKDIVRKCGGVPLALKTLGSLLYSKDEVEWIRVRDNEIWELEREDGRILPALRLSYNTMSPCLKQCFASCSTFSDDTPMYRIELISIWMALGILQSPNGKMEFEDIADLQIKELCARSFFQLETDDDDKDFMEIIGKHFFIDYKMHDLVHDLARSVTNSECSIIKSSREVSSDSVRHLRIFLNQNNFTVVDGLKKLWSIHIDNTSEETITESFLLKCISKLRYLRVFDLKELSFTVLPGSISNLKHLRYLNLSDNDKIKRLPESICELQSLQTLMLGGCDELEEIPRNIRKLVSLITLSVSTRQEHFPENGIGRLKSLRTLCIAECENLRSLPCDMKCCTTLRTLMVYECKVLDLASKSDEAVTNLSLQTVHIMDLPKTTALPGWLKGASQSLNVLLIVECNGLVALPDWLPNLVLLENLFIFKCNELSALPETQQLSSLRHFRIEDCSQLDTMFKLENVVMLTLKETAFPEWLHGASNAIKSLKIEDCPRLVALPEWICNFSSLKKLTIENCGELLTLPKGIQCLTSLTKIKITNCDQLELASESNEAVQMSLQKFYIGELPQTTSLPEWLRGAAHTLQELYIFYCPKLAALPEWLPDLTSLSILTIHCPQLLSLPKGISHLTSLKSLEIKSPSNAIYERYQPEIGRDWASIAHIPHIHIDNPLNKELFAEHIVRSNK